MTKLISRVARVMVGVALVATGSCEPRSPELPTPTTACPAFRDGEVTFSLAGSTYPVRLHLDRVAAAAKDGPLVLFFGLQVGSAFTPGDWFSAAGIERITAAGGVVAEILQNQQHFVERDRIPALADEIVACANEKVGIDARRIHTAGVGYTAEQAARLSLQRSSYVASVAVHRGGVLYEPAATNDKIAALITVAGSSPDLDAAFTALAISFNNGLIADGHYALLCDSSEMPIAAVQFFFDHPFGVSPSPYRAELPANLAALHCATRIVQ